MMAAVGIVLSHCLREKCCLTYIHIGFRKDYVSSGRKLTSLSDS